MTPARRETEEAALGEQRKVAATWPQGRGMDRSAPGRIRLGAVLLTLVVAAGIYLAVKFGPPYWTYLSMKDPVKEAAMALVTSTDEHAVRAELVRRAQEQGFTLDDEDIDITQDGSTLVVRVTWVAPVELPRYRYDLHFRIEERVPLR